MIDDAENGSENNGTDNQEAGKGHSREVDGFWFTSDEDASLAMQEYKKVSYLEEHIDEDDPEMIRKLYTKALDTRAFQTPVGLNFMHKLRAAMLKQGMDESGIKAIPLFVSYTQKPRQTPVHVRERIKPSEQKKDSGKGSLRISVILNILLLVLVIAMFVITLNSKNPNILNYETNITNKYAAWEQDLSQREAAIREKELENSR